MTLAGNSWLAFTRPNPSASLRLFCFSYAGGGASVFRNWSQSLPSTVEVCPVELPGRGVQLMEPLFTQLAPLVQAATAALLPLLDKPFAFFGHSMGALISYELACYLRTVYGLTPAHLFVSAHRAPHLPDTNPATYTLAERDFIDKLRTLNGTPREVLEQPELMQLVLPIVRADFEVCDTYAYIPRPPLECPISAFGGLDDVVVSRDQLDGWRAQTRGAFALRMFSGGHFFLQSASAVLLAILAQELRQLSHIHTRRPQDTTLVGAPNLAGTI